MSSYLCAFDDVQKLMEIKEWNDLARESKNPYYLNGFIQQFFKSAVRLGLKPYCLVYFFEKKAVGIAPIAIKSWNKMRFARFLTRSEFDPDFIVKEEYRESFLSKVIDFLFEQMGCTFLDFSLPSSSVNLKMLDGGKVLGGRFHIVHPIAGHSVIPVKESWAAFEKSRGKSFRKMFRRIERMLTESGEWCVEFGSQKYSQQEIFDNIQQVENTSWKKIFRDKNGVKQDYSLLELLTASYNVPCEEEFCWDVAFLVVNGKKIAYCFWYEFNGVAFIAKTSFNNEYKLLYPGIYINNVVIHELFNKPEIKLIDLMTDWPFQDKWAPEKIPRNTIKICNSYLLYLFFRIINSYKLMNIQKSLKKFVSNFKF